VYFTSLLLLLALPSFLKAQSWRDDMKAGNKHYNSKEYKIAEERYTSAANLLLRDSGNRNQQYATALLMLGKISLRTEDLNTAERKLQKAATTIKAASGESDEYVYANYYLAEVASKRGDCKKAVALYKDVITLADKVIGRDNNTYFYSIYEQALCYEKLGDSLSARPLHQMVIEIAQKLEKVETIEFITSASRLMPVYLKQNELRKVEKLTLLMLPVFEKNLTKEHPQYIELAVMMGRMYVKLEEPTKTIKWYEESQRLISKTKGSNNQHYLEVSREYAEQLITLNQFSKAEEILFHIRNVIEATHGSSDTAYATLNDQIAGLQMRMSRFKDAEQLALAALDIKKKKLPANHHDIAVTMQGLGYIYATWNDFPKALSYYIPARNIFLQGVGKRNFYYIASSQAIAGAHSSAGNLIEAEKILVELQSLLNDEQTPEQLMNYHHLGDLALQKEQFTEAERILNKAKTLVLQIRGLETIDNAQVSKRFGSLYMATGEYKKSEKYLQEALLIEQKIFGKIHLDVAATLRVLGGVYLRMGEFNKALDALDQASMIVSELLPKVHPERAVVMEEQALLYSEMGNYKLAEPLLLDALSIKEKAVQKNSHSYTSSLHSLGNLYQQTGRHEKALEIFSEVQKNYQRLTHANSSSHGSIANAIGLCYLNMARFKDAEETLEWAKAFAEKIGYADQQMYVGILINLSSLAQQLGQYAKAEYNLKKALVVTEKTFGKNHHEYGNILNNLAAVYSSAYHHDKAHSLENQALKIIESTVGKKHPSYAHSLVTVGARLYNKGEAEGAIPVLQQARQIFELTYGRNHAFTQSATLHIATAYMSSGRHAEADSIYRAAYQVQRQRFSYDKSAGADVLSNMAINFWNWNKPDSASYYFDQVYQLREELKNEIFRFAGERQKSEFIDRSQITSDFLHSFYYLNDKKQYAGKLFDLVLSNRNLVLTATKKQIQEVVSSTDDSTKQLYEKWTKLKTELSELYSRVDTSKDAEIQKLFAEAERVEKDLVKRSSVFTSQSATSETTWKDVQSALSPDEAVIEFINFRLSKGKYFTDSIVYAALVLQPGKKEPKLIPLFIQRQIDSLMTKISNHGEQVISRLYTRGVDDDEQDLRDRITYGAKLYNLVWQKIDSTLSGTKKVYFAPSGILHRISFAAIPVNDSTYLSDRYELTQLSNSALLKEEKLVQTKVDSLVLFGGITYGEAIAAVDHKDSSLDEVKLRSGWGELKGTFSEVQAINSLAQKNGRFAKTITGMSAQEEVMKLLSGRKSPDVIHIATHGFFFPDPRLDTTKVVTHAPAAAPKFKRINHPLFRSGLLFANANKNWLAKTERTNKDDGILTAYEVSNLVLQNTKLVVLSACETGLGDIYGNEGVYGLQRAFKMAGAQYLIMSLWKIPDIESAQFMEIFYSELFKRNDIPGSFRAAQSLMRIKYKKDPYNWAGFVLVQ
jgi:tetratricopeptide (TPR) repeat protein/CHAT domain-containing protein